MKRRLYLNGAFILIVFILAAAAMYLRSFADSTAIVLTGRNGERVVVHAERADTAQERSQGLMGRTSLGEGEGMLFLFEAPVQQPLSFWMKNTLIPLDILFFAADGTLVSSASMVPCTADPCPITTSSAPAAMALEVPAGFIQRHGISAGWSILSPFPSSL